ncbi:MAG TPA: type II toxin-antitoxin system prevent-host-death family antitoxin [Vicinamibacterales bacterium]|nr:type II toxin-antitoxin system prevent-host-death family antitoxin [Vicinamibacterales bacterium]
MTIGVRELKANLSACLRRVQAGERLTVTDRGRAVAVLAPVDTPASVGWAHAMVAKGLATWSGGKPAGMAKRIKSRGKPASLMVIEDRR